MREKAKASIGSDTFGSVSETVDWGNCLEIYFLHNNCKWKLHNARTLDQAKRGKKRKIKKKSTKALQKKVL